MNSLLRPQTTNRQLLTRILEESALVAEVRALPPKALAKLIDHVGLEDAGEIVQLATVQQIERVFDEDLWKSRDGEAGEDEEFDPKRFVIWLEILLEAGDRAAARRLAELPRDVITLAFHRLVIVVDVDELASDVCGASSNSQDGDAIEKALESSLNHEIGSFMVIARQHDGWDAIVTALVALDEEDHDACTRILNRCTSMTEHEADDQGGLYEMLLSAEESFEADVAGDRADRRAGDGFIAPSDARSFLTLTKQSSLDEIAKEARDPVTRAYFREVRKDEEEAFETEAPTRLMKLLKSAGVLDDTSTSTTTTKKKTKRRLPLRAQSPSPTLLHAALLDLAQTNPALHAERMEELAYLVNVLMSSGTISRAGDAAEEVVAITNEGLAYLTKQKQAADATGATAIVAAKGVVLPFRIGLRLRSSSSLVDEVA